MMLAGAVHVAVVVTVSAKAGCKKNYTVQLQLVMMCTLVVVVVV